MAGCLLDLIVVGMFHVLLAGEDWVRCHQRCRVVYAMNSVWVSTAVVAIFDDLLLFHREEEHIMPPLPAGSMSKTRRGSVSRTRL